MTGDKANSSGTTTAAGAVRHAASPALLGMVLVAGCYSGLQLDAGDGAAAGDAATEGASGGDDGAGDGADSGGDTPPPAGFEPQPAPMRRLTVTQYRNSIADIFGEEIELRVGLEVDETTEKFLSIGASQVGTSETGVAQYREAAFDIADQIFARRDSYALLADCHPAGADDPCVAAIVEHYGTRLWRRPVTESEIARYAALVESPYEEGVNPELGLQYMVSALVESPNFIYIVQVGEDDPSSDLRRFSSVEMASRLSYFLWNSTPDETLLQAASAGDLTDPDAIAEQALRMLEAPRAQDLVVRFFGEAWNVDDLDVTDKNPDVYPDWTQDTVDSYKTEFEVMLRELFARDGDIREIFDGKETFVDATLAELYGVPAPLDPDAPVVLDETRWGLLTAAAVIAANSPSDRTSPTLRGTFVFERLLCNEIPPPPNDVDDVLPDDEPGAEPKTTREKLEQHREDPACAGCHDLVDPPGLVFENYDAVGAFRSQENGMPVDPSTVFENQEFDGVADLATLLAGDDRATSCIAQNLLSYAAGREVTTVERDSYEALAVSLADAEFNFRELVVELVTHPTFRYVGEGEQ